MGKKSGTSTGEKIEEIEKIEKIERIEKIEKIEEAAFYLFVFTLFFAPPRLILARYLLDGFPFLVF